MNHYIDIAKEYSVTHKKQLQIGAIVAAGILLVGLFIGLYLYNTRDNVPEIVHQPLAACNAFTASEAKELLGSDVLDRASEPTIAGNQGTSKCSYTDKNPDQNQMAVAAVAVRSGINDEGVQENKNDFNKSRAANKVEVVEGLGDSAFFIPLNGQLNVLKGNSWIIMSYGHGTDLGAFTLDDAKKLAEKVIDQPSADLQVTF